ncbi:MAG: SDR family oxidoreductase [Elainella sp. Prado103]|nr:SDR family oxidoreductase [Elainella sp. Prado103]
MQLVGKVALITGANSGIGFATAQLFAQQGAKVAMLGHSPADIEAAATQVQQWGEVIPLVADVTNAEAMQAAIGQVMEKWNRLDIVFANAGINGVWAPVDKLELQDWNQTINVNLTGTFLTVKYAIPHLKQQGGSIIVNSSVNGTRMFSNTGATAYACSKAAQVAFTKMVALELAKCHVRINVICPGAIATGLITATHKYDLEGVGLRVDYPEGAIPLSDGQLGTAEQVAQLVLFLASEASSHITGTEIWIDGGQSLIQG